MFRSSCCLHTKMVIGLGWQGPTQLLKNDALVLTAASVQWIFTEQTKKIAIRALVPQMSICTNLPFSYTHTLLQGDTFTIDPYTNSVPPHLFSIEPSHLRTSTLHIRVYNHVKGAQQVYFNIPIMGPQTIDPSRYHRLICTFDEENDVKAIFYPMNDS